MAYKIETEDQIMTFTIDRPEIRNAINFEVMEGLEELVELANAEMPRLVIITAAGDKAFCSGGDLSVFHALETEEEAYPMLKRMGEVLYRIKTLPIPVAALVNGTAVGGGCEIATACDYRLVRSHVKAGFIQGTLAITSGWGGGTYLFDTMPHDEALKMLSGAQLYTAEQLLANGWATAVIDSNEDMAAFLEPFRKVLPEVHRAYKEMAVRRWQATDLEARVEAEIRRCAQLWAGPAHHEAVGNFMNKTKK